MGEIVQIPELGLHLPQAAGFDGSQWSHNKTSAGLLPSYWRGQGMTIAVHDTGINPHPALDAWVVNRRNMVDGSADVTDTNGHGSGTAGMAGGALAVAHQAWLAIYKISNDPSGAANTDTIAGSVLAAMNDGVMVSSISYDVSSSYEVGLAAAEYAFAGGILVVAGGNSGAAHAHLDNPNMIEIGATDIDDNKPVWDETDSPHTRYWAPGVNVLTTDSAGGYHMVSGTSFSAPFVASVCAIIKQIRPTYDIRQVIGCLNRWLWEPRRVNVARAVYAAKLRYPLLEA